MLSSGHSLILVFLIGLLAVIAALWLRPAGRHKRYLRRAKTAHGKFLRGKLRGGKAMAYLRKMNPYVFEELVLDGFESNGFRVKRNRRYSGDGGIDGKVSFNDRVYLIQCKRYKGYINRGHLEMFCDMCRANEQFGFFVHTGKTGKGSIGLVPSYNRVMLISGDKLLNLLSFEGNPDLYLRFSHVQ